MRTQTGIYVRFAICAFIWLCILEAAFWPLMYIPGTRLAWWQLGFLADIGFVLGVPVWIVVIFLGQFVSSSEIFLVPTTVVLSVAYLWVVFSLLGRIAKR
jgi:hypothetical protein